jgi:hypothetical protein
MTNDGQVLELVAHADRVIANLHLRLDDPAFWDSDHAHRSALMRRLDSLLEEIMIEAPQHRPHIAALMSAARADFVRHALMARPGQAVERC